MLTSQCSDPLCPHTWPSPFPAALLFVCGKCLSHILHALRRKRVAITARDTNGNRCVQHLKSSKPVFSDAQVWAHQTSYSVNEQWQADRRHCVPTVLDAVVLQMSGSIAQHVSRVFSSKVNTVTKWFSLRNVLRALTLNLPGQNIKSRNWIYLWVFLLWCPNGMRWGVLWLHRRVVRLSICVMLSWRRDDMWCGVCEIFN